ncbi:MAG: CheR family methyltransferase [Paracoccaceae bacterium]
MVFSHLALGILNTITDSPPYSETPMSDMQKRSINPVIAIGASAGGLEASRALLANVAADSAAAFILILHLDPTHDSLAVELLAKGTKLGVVQAQDGMSLKPGVLHVIPPGMFLTVASGVIHLAPPVGGKSVRLPIDTLLQSLALEVDTPKAAVILSGTGTDGSLGIVDLHAAGGLVVVQDPRDAGFPGMPESAIATGCVTQVLPADQIAAALQAFCDRALHHIDRPVSGLPGMAFHVTPPATAEQTGPYDSVFALLSEHAAQDLTLYKRGTLERRVARRMALGGLGPNDVPVYLNRLRSDTEERDVLTNDLLIHVTGFFRDPAVFDHLARYAVPELVAAARPDKPLRIWVAGCSTGEEAYSLAMIFIEALADGQPAGRLQILASDIDPESIATARAGRFSDDIAQSVSPARLERFFIAEDGGYRVTSALRDVIVFTVADLLSDPPFSRMDLVSCRNVLIYLGLEAQKRVIARCCFALRPGGLLVLGSAEMPGANDACFAPEDKGARIWRRVGKNVAGDMHISPGKRDGPLAAPAEGPVRRTVLADLCRSIVLEYHAPAAVLLNSQLDCLYFLGPTEKYLTVPKGHPDPGILGMLPRALQVRFRAAAVACTPATPRVAFSAGLGHGTAPFDIVFHSVPSGPEPLLVACFLDTFAPVPSRDAKAAPISAPAPSPGLEAELALARVSLSDALRDLEIEVEAHNADAAEALSVNEEFQSTNEELLASKEELQSLNEELTALNSQLQETLERHRNTANDLQNVLYSTDVATLFLNLDLNIRFFTPAARAIFRVIPTDIGRPLADLAAIARDDALPEDAKAVLATLEPIEREVAANSGRWFLRRIQPYRTEGGRVEGVVITYVDITERLAINAALIAAKAEAERATRAKSRFLASASHDLRQPLQSMALLQSLLARPKRSAEGLRLAALMDQTLNSMTAMLDSMLDVTRIEAGIVRPDIGPVALAPLMQRLADEFRPQCEAKGLKLRLVVCKAFVLTDPQLLEQILRNLFSNALKYTLTGGLLLGCRRKGQQIGIQLCDTGIGIPEAEQRLIFDAYRQGEAATTLAGPGLGLGLSIVQRLAQLMGHTVSLRSVPKKGSCFIIGLPIVDPRQQDPDPETHVLPLNLADQTGTILVVEDDETLGSLLCEVLENEGHTVISRTAPAAALDWASKDVARPDLLLTDFDLPGKSSGLSLALDLPNILGVTLPTIILTGDITSGTATAIHDAGFDQVRKPVLPEILLARISDMLRIARAARVDNQHRPDATHTTLHVIDDDPVIRETLRRLFQAEGWGVMAYPSAEDFLARPRPRGQACLLVDQVLPGITGTELLQKLQAEKSPCPSIILTGHGDAVTAVAAIKAGASDLIEKPASAADLLAAVRLALRSCDQGKPQTAKDVQRIAQNRLSGLTERESQVLALVLAGAPNKNIAADLGINQRTVEHHRASVMRKTGAKSLPALVRLALDAAEVAT